MAGIWGNAGDLEAKYGDHKLVVKAAAPGTFFAILGTVVLAFTIWKGLNLGKVNVNTASHNSENSLKKEMDEIDNLKPDFTD